MEVKHEGLSPDQRTNREGESLVSGVGLKSATSRKDGAYGIRSEGDILHGSGMALGSFGVIGGMKAKLLSYQDPVSV